MHPYSAQKIGDKFVYTRIFEEWEDTDYKDQDDDEKLVINPEVAQLIAWIDEFEDSIPTMEEVQARYQEMFGKHIADNRSHRKDIERFWKDRLFNGTAASPTSSETYRNMAIT
jgi:hypothetical protein